MSHADDSNSLQAIRLQDRVGHVHIPLANERLRVPASPISRSSRSLVAFVGLF